MHLEDTPYDVQACNWTVKTLWPAAQVLLDPWVDTSMVVGAFGLVVEDITNQEWAFTNFTTRHLRVVRATGTINEAAQIHFGLDRKAYWYTINIIIPSQVMWVLILHPPRRLPSPKLCKFSSIFSLLLDWVIWFSRGSGKGERGSIDRTINQTL